VNRVVLFSTVAQQLHREMVFDDTCLIYLSDAGRHLDFIQSFQIRRLLDAPIKATTFAKSSTTDFQSPDDDYLFSSVCGDLVISEMVNAPVNVVALYFPCCVLE
jgi:hypothetical protein